MLKHFMQPDTTTRAESVRPNPEALATIRTREIRPPEPVVEEPTPAETGNKLIVGPNIKLKGSEITDCEILVVEGRVEASMNSRDIRIAEGGVVAGKAVIDVAEVRGCFEGDLTARKRLVIHATGRVTGTIRYGAMMVEEGGTLVGDIAMLDASATAALATESPSRPANDTSSEEPEEKKRSVFAKA